MRAIEHFLSKLLDFPLKVFKFRFLSVLPRFEYVSLHLLGIVEDYLLILFYVRILNLDVLVDAFDLGQLLTRGFLLLYQLL